MSQPAAPLPQDDPALWWNWFTTELAAGRADTDALASDLILAVQKGGASDQEVPGTILRVLSRNDAFARVWKMGEANDVRAISDLAKQGAIAAAFDSDLARFFIANFLIPSPAAELILTQARRAILMQVIETPEARHADPVRKFIYALAQQCFLNEYAYWEEPDEAMWAEVLTGNTAAMMEEGDPNADIALAVLGCYRSLVPWPDETQPDLRALRSPDDGFRVMMSRLVSERLEELDLARALPALTPIQDETSQAVRSMYEENPYPRWCVPHLPPTVSPATAVQWMFPHADKKAFGEVPTPRVLIAGCGTGFLTTALAKLFGRADITAIDLSRASLAYAKRQATALKLKVNFAQADILALDPSKLQFDIIECGGVLHHTADVMRSWRVLTSCLKPGGLMDVALYNSRARDWLHAPRRFAQTGGYRATQKDIRRFRRDILRAPAGALPSGLAETLTKPDFYTLSMCRDAFFHIQEREFALREILAMVEQLGLEFLGLKIADAVTQQRYVERYPDDPAVRNLRYIEAQEDAMREFAGPMYMLLLQRRPL